MEYKRADIEIRESKLEDIIFNHLSSKKINKNIQEHFKAEDAFIVKRQLNLGMYGIPDIIVFNSPDVSGILSIKIIELKKGVIDKNTIMQALKYKIGFEKYFKDSDMYRLDISIHLIGNRISNDKTFKILASEIGEIYIKTYDMDTEKGLFLKDHSHEYVYDLESPLEVKEMFKCISYEQHDLSCNEYHYDKQNCSILNEYHRE